MLFASAQIIERFGLLKFEEFISIINAEHKSFAVPILSKCKMERLQVPHVQMS